jgi:hypothetical protein
MSYLIEVEGSRLTSLARSSHTDRQWGKMWLVYQDDPSKVCGSEVAELGLYGCRNVWERAQHKCRGHNSHIENTLSWSYPVYLRSTKK